MSVVHRPSGRPTSAGSRDLSGLQAATSDAPNGREDALFRAYGALKPGQSGLMKVVAGDEIPCVCGGFLVRTDGESIENVVVRHNSTPVHVAYRTWRELVP